MEKSAPSDHELLSQWLREHREAAFHSLVGRYTALVHATARRTCGDESIATEASQLTFITLSGKASSLLNCASLGGWLHATAMMHARNLIRKSQREDRKRHHLQRVMETSAPDTASTSVWKEMEPLLDEALAALPAKDREALLLRFYRSLTIREIATTLGIATAAAQKRVDRATERLRVHLARRGCQAGGTLAAAMVTGFATDAQAALPAASTLASKALATSAVAGAGSLATFAALLTATTLKKATLLVVLLALGLAWRFLPGADGKKAEISGGAADQASSAPSIPESAGIAQDTKSLTASEESSRPEPADPIERSPAEIRKALVAKAREMIDKDLGGVTDQDKTTLLAAIREFDALLVGGLSDQHPRMLVSLATFSRKIDRLSSYTDAEWNADAAAFLRSRLAEVEALPDGASTAALRKRWVRDQSRDDLPEALILRTVRPFGPTAGTKEGLRDDLNRWIKSFEGAGK